MTKFEFATKICLRYLQVFEHHGIKKVCSGFFSDLDCHLKFPIITVYIISILGFPLHNSPRVA